MPNTLDEEIIEAESPLVESTKSEDERLERMHSANW